MERESLTTLSLLVLLSLLSWMALRSYRSFFSLPPLADVWIVPFSWLYLLGAFLSYFLASFLITPLWGSYLQHHLMLTWMTQLSWMNFFNSALILLLIALELFAFPPYWGRSIWRQKTTTWQTIRGDGWAALSAWLVAFPWVLLVNQGFDWMLTSLFHIPQIPEQIAVRFLKMTFNSPLLFSMTSATIVLFAPCIEETLFRGLLQTYMRRYLGSRQAIGISALLFACFHYAPEQGIGNLPIVSSLFILALFLGFLYEKRRSLLSPILLHASFNGISIVNLYFFAGAFKEF